MNEIWNEICFKLQSCAQRDVLETEYENTIANCMSILNWKESKNEIVRQVPIQVGRRQTYPDIVIFLNNVVQFVIEVKRPNHHMQEDDKRQLQSYMRQLKVQFGIYIGKNIHLFYDDNSQSAITNILTIEIKVSDSNGDKFVELFQKDCFNLQTIEEFCIAQKQKQEEIAKLLADTTGESLKQLLKKKYLNEGFSADWAEDVLSKIRIHITSTSPLPIIDVPQNSPQVNAKQTVSTNKKKTTPKFRLHGNILCERKFALEFVRLFVQEHPMTYDEYEQIFNSLPTHIPRKMIRDLEEIKKMNDPRFFIDEKNHLHSTDGKTFVVNREWTEICIQPVVDFANEQGYNVEIIQH